MGRTLASLALGLLLLASSVQTVAWAGPVPPSVDWVWVNLGRHISPDGEVLYWERLWRITVSDADGTADIASIDVVDTEGQQHSVPFEPNAGTTLVTNWDDWDSPTPPPPGAYVITVVDTDGNSDSLTTPVTPDVSGPPFLQLTYPATPDGVIIETVPEFQWAVDLPGGAVNNIWLSESGVPGHVWTKVGGSLGTATSCVYNFDGTATEPELTPGRAYGWQIDSWDDVDPGLTDPRVSISVVDVAQGSFVVYSPAPAIEWLGIHRGCDVDLDGTDYYHEMLDINVTDADGAGDISEIIVTDTEGLTYVIEPETGETPTWYAHWEVVSPLRVYVHWAQEGPEALPPPGTYTVTVVDGSGNSSTLTTDPLGPVPEMRLDLLSPARDEVIYETAPTFSWDGGAEGAGHEVRVFRESDWSEVWQAWTGSETTATYNFDGSAAEPELVPGAHYIWQAVAWWEDSPEQSDPRVEVTVAPHASGRFVVYAPEPTIEHIALDRGRDVEHDGTVVYHERARVWVTDADGMGDIASVTIIDTEGNTHECELSEDWGASGAFDWQDWGTPEPPPPGPYTVTVTDLAGHWDAITTAATAEVYEVSPEIVSPPANDSVVYDTTPVFSWTEAIPGEWHSLAVWMEGGDWLWEYGTSGETSVEYNVDGTAAQPELPLGYTYGWHVEMWRDDDPGITDPRVYISTAQHAWGLFRVYTDPVPIEGKMFVTSDGGTYFLEGDSNNRTFSDTWFSEGDISPHGDKMAYDAWLCCLTGAGWPDLNVEIWTANLDGSGASNISGAAGLGGVSCYPQWSPDGSMVAFQHSEGGAGGVLPCEVGFHVWVMNADGTDAHRVTPDGHNPTVDACWAPNGYRLLCTTYPPGWSEDARMTIDIDGTDIVELANVGGSPKWSPDGAKIASGWTEPGVVAGEPGVWRQLRLTDADGGDPVTLVEQFVNDAEAQVHLEAMGMDPVASLGDLQHWVGPRYPEWSPNSERIAFLSAFPFDPAGPHYKQQSEIWMYDLGTAEVSRVTYDWWQDSVVSWGGPNTSPEDPSVTVDNTTVTFSDVADDGLTTIIRDDDPPAAPTGYQFCGEYYEIDSTATYAGPISICMSYDEADIPHGNENSLKLMHYNETTGDWEDITTSHDKVANILCGEADSLSVFGIAAAPEFAGLLQPINNDGSSIFKLNRTVPVKFQFVAPDGSYVSDAVAKLYVAKVTDEVVGSYEEPESTSSADVGNTFRYDATADQYIFNLGTKALSTGTWSLRVEVNGMVEKEVWISLR